ncbi:Hypothetical predicted protein [Lecanosticta acicola]|uniref:Uncharacterized protein n=1 Tax=Lecanosticta acicola TaxID=111012 RepID=A0AAI8Z808_9PEZI|nr:Hypothetical predicted protein [Lecanosticta acicola]
MDHQQSPQHNHKCKEAEAVGYSSPDSVLARRNSAVPGTASGADATRTAGKRSMTASSREDGDAHTMEYDTSSGPTPPYTPAPSPMLSSTCSENMTEDEIRRDVILFIGEEMEAVGEYSWCFQFADDKPPITPESLAELDMPRIINNPKLRHDVNFDRELHFRPNLDGSKGKQKIAQADRYWKALEAEFVIHNLALQRRAQSLANDAYWSRVGKASLVRLPKIFAAIRDILKTLVPDYDQKAVQERLEVDHLMQQIHNGVLDLVSLGNWLARILKNHCAPMRDQLVDTMRQSIENGAVENDCKKLVSGLRQLMTILEHMKLDVANHQIRHMRPLLIEDTINFQRRYNAHRIAVGKINATDAKLWLDDKVQPHGYEPTPLLALTRGLIGDLVYNPTSSSCPQTFYLDSDRLRALRLELHSRTYLAICRDVLWEMSDGRLSESDLIRASDALQSSIAAIVGTQGRFVDRIENIAAEIVRVLLVAEDRHLPFDSSLVMLAEQKLVNYLRQDCAAFRENARFLVDELVPKVQDRVREHVRLSALHLQDALVPPALPKHSSMGFGAVCEPTLTTSGATPIDPDEDLIRRFTHIIALHWDVWADLVYLVETPEKEEDGASEHGSDSTILHSQTNSPTIPVAQAVYAPGRKWLPISVTVTDVQSSLPTPAASPPSEDESAPGTHEQKNEE